jgi:hypothetical protein
MGYIKDTRTYPNTHILTHQSDTEKILFSFGSGHQRFPSVGHAWGVPTPLARVLRPKWVSAKWVPSGTLALREMGYWGALRGPGRSTVGGFLPYLPTTPRDPFRPP